MPKISVIVPIYKAEKYLRKCVDSILNQTFSDFELILVDDGSPDQSGQICDEYAGKDKRINVIHKKNDGVSSARQSGLDASSGDYVIHADPDDWVEPQMLKELYAKAIDTNADLVYCDFYQDYANGVSKYVCQRLTSPLTSESMLIALLEGHIHGSCWNKLIKREKILKYKLRFIPQINICEDRQFCLELLLNGDIAISYQNKAYYHYCLGINDNSIVFNTRKQVNYLFNRYFIDFAVNEMSSIPYYRDRYIIGNIYFVVISSAISQKKFCNEFKQYLPYVRLIVPFYKYLVVKTSFYGLKTLWYMLGGAGINAVTYLAKIKNKVIKCFHIL